MARTQLAAFFNRPKLYVSLKDMVKLGWREDLGKGCVREFTVRKELSVLNHQG